MASLSTNKRYILCGRILSSPGDPRSARELAMIELLRSCDAIWIKSEKIARLIAGDRFVPISEIAKEVEIAEAYTIGVITHLRSGGLQIEGTIEKGYHLPSKGGSIDD
jgi:biotin operon repressor